ncbi:MAG: hypothetical protein Q9221_007501 [Calogaya cf. arnoldii]
MAVAGWCYEDDPDLRGLAECSVCLAKEWDWYTIKDPLQKHLKLCGSCPVAQALKAQKSKARAAAKIFSAPAIPTPKLLPNNKLSSPQGSVIMKPTAYEKRLTTYTKWPHHKPSAADMAAAGWCFEADQYC